MHTIVFLSIMCYNVHVYLSTKLTKCPHKTSPVRHICSNRSDSSATPHLENNYSADEPTDTDIMPLLDA